MEKSEIDKKSFIKHLFNSKKINFKAVIIGVLVLIILVIFISSFNSNPKNQKETKIENISLASEYCREVENRLKYVLAGVKGIGNINVFVMVDSSPTIKYLEETSTTNKEGDGSSIQTTIVFAKNGTISTPVVVVELMPKITGVLVVATGAKDVKMKTTLINTVSAVLDVDISNVEVLEGK